MCDLKLCLHLQSSLQKVCKNGQVYTTVLLGLAFLADATQIGLLLFVPHHPRQAEWCNFGTELQEFSQNLCKCKQTLIGDDISASSNTQHFLPLVLNRSMF
jgi:hypothetical protein